MSTSSLFSDLKPLAGKSLIPFLPSLAITLLLLFCYRLLIRSPRFEHDDAYIIHLATTLEWYQLLYIPAIYQQLSTAHLTPLTVPFYSLIQYISSFSPSVFLNAMMVLFGLWICLCIVFLRAHFKLPERYLILFVVLLLSIESTGTILSRFYTAHYLLAGIFGTAALIALNSYKEKRHSFTYMVAMGLMLLALLSKEILIAILPISFILFFHDRELARKIFITGIITVFVYLAYRSYMLGELIGGRTGENGLYQGLKTIFEALPSFLEWYVSGRVSLLLALACAIFLSPHTILVGLLIAAMLAAPALAAPHGFSHPELHGDRLFIASDFALVATATIGLAQQEFLERIRRHRAALVAVSIVVIAGISVSFYQTHLYDSRARDSLEYRVFKVIFNHQPIPTAIFLPENYHLGSMIVALKKHHPHLRAVTSDCFEALAWQGTDHLLLDLDGQPTTREKLAERCGHFDSPPILNGEVIYDKGILRWSIVGADQLQVGVYFPDHALFISERQFEERLVRPAVDENYKLYARDQTRWWFSETKKVVFR
jgi:hypothetical protein